MDIDLIKSSSYLITNACIFTGEQVLKDKNIVVQNGKVTSIIAACQQPKYQNMKVIDLGGKNIAPGFIDIQINGGKQWYFSHAPNQQTLNDIYQTSCEYGTPYILPTLISSPLEIILQSIEAVRQFMHKNPSVLGMHLQGPFLNPKKRGAHNADIIRKPTDEQLNLILLKGKGVIKIITIAPQCLTEQQLQMVLKSDIIVSMGHCDLTYQQTQYYFSKGIRLVTHLFNAMTQMSQRQCGTVGAIFDNQDVYASIILDGGHCHYAAARIAYRQKNDKLILTTDSSFLGRNKLKFEWPAWRIQMKQGFYRDKEGNLAGAAISMPEAVKNAKQNLKISLQDAIQMATSRVSKAIKMQNRIGFIKPGYQAKFTIFDSNLQKIQGLFL